MIPNLAIMICSYIVFRCVEAFVKQDQKMVVVVFAVVCVLVSVLTTFLTLMSGTQTP